MCRCSANLIHLNRRRRSDIQLLISGIYELCDGERKSQIDNYSCLELEVGDFAKFWRSIIIYASKSLYHSMKTVVINNAQQQNQILLLGGVSPDCKFLIKYYY